MNNRNPYSILRISPSATFAEIRQAYKTLSRVYHPDKHANGSVQEKLDAEREFKEINEAYQLLSKKNHYARRTDVSSEDVNAMSIVPYHDDYLNDANFMLEDVLVPLMIEENGADYYKNDSINDSVTINQFFTSPRVSTTINQFFTSPKVCTRSRTESKIENLRLLIINPLLDLPNSEQGAFTLLCKQYIRSTEVDEDFYLNEIVVFLKKYMLSEPYNSEFINQIKKEEVLETLLHAAERYKNITCLITEKAFCWKAEKKGCADVYLFGSIHKFPFDALNIFGDAVDTILDNVKVVFTEVARTIPHSNNNTEKNLGLDDFIAKKAFDMKKELKPLENTMIREALGVDPRLPSYSNIEQEELEELTRQYLTNISYGDSTPKANKEDPIVLAAAINRNLFWMDSSIRCESEQQNASLVVCGGAHNHGQFGLANLLVADGYTLTPLMKTPPVPRNALLKDAMFGLESHHMLVFNPPMCSQKNSDTALALTLPHSKPS